MTKAEPVHNHGMAYSLECEACRMTSKITLAEFREACRMRRLTYANDWYHLQIEQLFAARDQWEARAEQLQKELGKLALKLNYAIDRLAQHRDFTLTARRMDESFFWEVQDSSNRVVYQLHEWQAQALERWSREGAKVEPCFCGRIDDHIHGAKVEAPECAEFDKYKAQKDAIVARDKPPGPDISESWEHLVRALGGGNAEYIAENIRQLCLALIGDKHGKD